MSISAFRVQGRIVDAADLEQIRQLLADNPSWGRSRLSGALCPSSSIVSLPGLSRCRAQHEVSCTGPPQHSSTARQRHLSLSPAKGLRPLSESNLFERMTLHLEDAWRRIFSTWRGHALAVEFAMDMITSAAPVKTIASVLEHAGKGQHTHFSVAACLWHPYRVRLFARRNPGWRASR